MDEVQTKFFVHKIPFAEKNKKKLPKIRESIVVFPGLSHTRGLLRRRNYDL